MLSIYALPVTRSNNTLFLTSAIEKERTCSYIVDRHFLNFRSTNHERPEMHKASILLLISLLNMATSKSNDHRAELREFHRLIGKSNNCALVSWITLPISLTSLACGNFGTAIGCGAASLCAMRESDIAAKEAKEILHRKLIPACAHEYALEYAQRMSQQHEMV